MSRHRIGGQIATVIRLLTSELRLAVRERDLAGNRKRRVTQSKRLIRKRGVINLLPPGLPVRPSSVRKGYLSRDDQFVRKPKELSL